jgi:hypothetical protein
MAYTITKSDGSVLTTIADGTIDATTSLELPGPNYVGYGQFLNENLVYLLENFAANTAPGGTNLQGQLWFDKANQVLKVYTSQGYFNVAGAVVASAQPTLARSGDTWFNTTTNQLFLYDGTAYKLVGPEYTKAQGESGAIPETVNDATVSGVTHNILKLKFGTEIFATVSKDPSFTATPAIPGFTTIHPGITFSSNVAGAKINADIVGSLTGDVTGDVYSSDGTLILNSGTDRSNSIFYGDVYSSLGAVILENGTDGTNAIFTGTVIGNVTGNTTSVRSTVGTMVATNFSTANAVITGGYVNNLSNAYVGTTHTTNFSTANAVITGGYVNSLSNITATSATFTNLTATNNLTTNFSTANAVITGGYIRSLSNLSVATTQANNFSTANAVITGGYVNNLSNVTATTASFTNLTATAVTVSGGNITGLTNLSVTTLQPANLITANAQITGGNVSNIVGTNNTFTTANLVNSIATTKSYDDSSNAIATTSFVQSVFPRGMIMMWNSTSATIPVGWQLCDGSNGTPDLRGQFIIGAGGAYAFGANGGATTTTLGLANIPGHFHSINAVAGNTSASGAHTHTASSSSVSSVTDPGHTHTTQFPTSQTAYAPSQYISGTVIPLAQSAGGTIVTQANVSGNSRTNVSVSTTTSTSVSNVADHTHTLTVTGNTGTTGSGASFSTLPPYFALCYIQKMY